MSELSATTAAAPLAEQQQLMSPTSSSREGMDDFVACTSGATLRMGEDGVIVRSMLFHLHLCRLFRLSRIENGIHVAKSIS
jgi:hypothetical protein